MDLNGNLRDESSGGVRFAEPTGDSGPDENNWRRLSDSGGTRGAAESPIEENGPLPGSAARLSRIPPKKGLIQNS